MKRQIVFRIEDLMALLVHYTEGQIPRDAEAKEFSRHPLLDNLYRIGAVAKYWPGAKMLIQNDKLSTDIFQPLEFRYEGRKILTWDDKGQQPKWRDRGEAAKGSQI